MFLECRPVSRKTPLDGRLDISAQSAARLGGLGSPFPVVALGREGAGRLQALTCTCAKGGDGGHVHHFVVSPLLRELDAGSEVVLQLDEGAGVLCVENRDSNRPFPGTSDP